MITCTKCHNTKPEDAFHWANKTKGIRAGRCKSCRNKYNNETYNANKNGVRERQKAYGVEYRKKARQFIVSYLSEHPCVDCGYSDVRALQFDHIIPLSDARASRVGRFTSIKRIKEEIMKCEVRCANCHMIKTGTEYGWRPVAL